MDLSHRPHLRGCALTAELQAYADSSFQSDPNSLLRSLSHFRDTLTSISNVLRKEVIQPQVLLRLPCCSPSHQPELGRLPPEGWLSGSAPVNSHGVTGGVYKARERIHRGVLIRDYWRSSFTQSSCRLRSEAERLLGFAPRRRFAALCDPIVTRV